jgi:HSP20 family protein
MFGSTLFRSSALADLWRLQNEIEELFSDAAPGPIRSLPAGSFPALNVGQTPDQVDVHLFAPGIDAQTLKVNIEQNLLTISGTRTVPPTEGATQYRKERFDGAFQRAVTLPEDVNPEAVEAKYRNGVVHITIQRRQAAKPRQIAIQSA